LTDQPIGIPTSGRILFDGADLSRLSQRELRGRRRDIKIMCQDPRLLILDARDICAQEAPALLDRIGVGHPSACHVPEVRPTTSGPDGVPVRTPPSP
jgi:hypothetical protein